MRSSHIVSDAPRALRVRAMNNENSPAGGNCGRGEKEGEGRALSLDRMHGWPSGSWGRIYSSAVLARTAIARGSVRRLLGARSGSKASWHPEEN
jgi:hypothetical protein